MNIVIETGEGLSNANSYVGTDESKEIASDRSLPFPCDNADVKALMLKATDYIESFSHRFPGVKLLDDQSLSYPRDICGQASGIPKELKLAIVYTMSGMHEGFNPVANKDSKPFITRESVDVLRIDYAESSQYNQNKLPMVDRLLNQLFEGKANIRFIRG